MNHSLSNRGWKAFLSWEKAAAALLIVLGMILRIRQYLTGRSLWADEAMLALNIVNRGFAGMFQPLEYDQGAPIGFLLVEKLINTVLGKHEFALRLFPLLVGLTSLWLFYLLLKNLTSGPGLLVPLALFAFNPRLIYYSSEVKQYIVDVAVTILLLLVAGRVLPAVQLLAGGTICQANRTAAISDGTSRQIVASQKKGYAWLTVAGLVALWFSHPALFVLAGIGLALGIINIKQRDDPSLRLVLGMGLIWLLNVAFLYFLILRNLSQNAYMREYWQGAFLPMPPWSDPGWFAKALNENIGIQFGIPYAVYLVFFLMLVGWILMSLREAPVLSGAERSRRTVTTLAPHDLLSKSSAGEQSHVQVEDKELDERLLRPLRLRRKTRLRSARAARNDGASRDFETTSINQNYAIAFACIVLVTLTASALGLYPVFERMILFLVPIGLILIGMAVEAIYERLQRNGLPSLLGVSLLAVYLLYGPVLTSLQNFIAPKYFEHIRPTMQTLRDSWKEGDAMFVSYGSLPAFQFYAPFYDLQSTPYALGRREDYQNPQAILNQLEPYQGQPRMWILFSHVYERGDFNEREFILNYLDSIGEKKREIRVPGTSVFLYLYDLGK